jgi:hypothetical protein
VSEQAAQTAMGRLEASGTRLTTRLVLMAVAFKAGWDAVPVPASVVLGIPELADMTRRPGRAVADSIGKLIETGDLQVAAAPDGDRSKLLFVIPATPPVPAAAGPSVGSGSLVGPGLTRIVFDRDGWQCVSCGSHADLSVDHVTPRSRGGTDDLENLQTMCIPCNVRKGARV